MAQVCKSPPFYFSIPNMKHSFIRTVPHLFCSIPAGENQLSHHHHYLYQPYSLSSYIESLLTHMGRRSLYLPAVPSIYIHRLASPTTMFTFTFSDIVLVPYVILLLSLRQARPLIDIVWGRDRGGRCPGLMVTAKVSIASCSYPVLSYTVHFRNRIFKFAFLGEVGLYSEICHQVMTLF